jgi:acyl carrier protein
MSTNQTTAPVTVEIALEAINEALEERGDDVAGVNGGTPLDSLGLASLELAELFMALEELTGERLDPDSAAGIETVGELTRLRPL